MRIRFLCPILLLMLTAPVFAHPGIGIVMNSRGEVFYTELKHVWKISPDGNKSIAVANVHTHELYIDANDNLYGEHLWYEGEATDKWGHYVWKLHVGGRLEQVIPPREGSREDYQDCSFVRDRVGNMYWAERGEPTIIRKRAPDGTITDFCTTHDFRDVRWMVCSADGSVYLIDDSDLRRIASDGTVNTIAHILKERSLPQAWIGGLWLDAKRNIYVAAYSGRQVKRVSMDGKVTIAAHSNAPWGPTGGLVAPNGGLWLLEYSTANTARVRQIRSDGTEKIH